MFATLTRKAGVAIATLALAAALLMLVLPKLGESQQAGAGPAHQIDLWAASGNAAMPDGASVPIWGFADQDPAGGGAAGLPGPLLRVNQGEEVTVTLHNTLDENVSFMASGLDMAPDTAGVAAGDQKSYTFTADKPGTYLYESGVEPQKQVQMGLYGVLIVEPPDPNQAYNDPSTAYDREAVMVLSEIDPAFHADPNGYDPANYAPKYFLINGKAYPDTANIGAAAGNKVLFRYVNAGYVDHTLQLLGMTQSVIAADANLLNDPLSTFSQTVAPGESYDLLSTVPASAAAGTKFPLYSAGMELTNGGGDSPGGMMTFVEVQ